MNDKYISYLRVSTQQQGRSGLGLEAQRLMNNTFVLVHGGAIVREYIEVDSGGNDERVELALAMKHAHKVKGNVLVAKLDRLSREVSYISTLMAKGIRYVVAELGPDVDPFMLHIYAAVAQKERALISARTKAALAAKKARGGVLGHPDFKAIRHLGPAAYSEKRRKANNGRTKLVNELRGKGLTLEQIAAELMDRGVKTARDKDEWTATQVWRLIDDK